ncbi:hypothetical protein CR513_13569, partial [Mucuna pruriens]
MQKIPYASVVGSLMYLSDHGMQHWNAVKRVMRYLRRTKGYMLTYWKSEGLDIIRMSRYLWVVNGIKRPLKIYCDNNLAVLYSNNNRSSTKSKFIDIMFLVFKERVQNKQISIEHIGTSFMLTNPLTKGLIPK